MSAWTSQVIEEFRGNGGRVGGVFEGADLLLLTTVGARSGERRTTPLGYGRDGDRILVYASNAGSDLHPGWYHNLLARPRVEAEIPDGRGAVLRVAARAEVVRGAERDRLYAEQAARAPAYGEYEARTDRVIPVVALHRLDLTVADPARNRAIARQLTEVHAMLRAQLAALREGAVGPAELAVHCLAFCESLGAHHAAEDAVLPAFDSAFPQLAPVLVRLRREHREVARNLEELRAMIADSDTGSGLLRDRIDAVAAQAERHFAYEEEHLLPVLTTP